MIPQNSMPSIVMDTQDVKNSVFSKIRKYIKKLKSGSLTFSYCGRPIRAQKVDVVRILSQINFEKSEELCVRNIILESVLSAESFAVGSGFLVLENILGLNSNSSYKGKARSDIDDITTCISDLIGEGLSREIVYSIIKNASIDSDVSVSTSDIAFYPSLRSLPCTEVPAVLSPLFNTKRKVIQNSSLLIIDGVIESLGEIENILQSFHSSKKTLTIIARGYSPDVVLTFAKNHKLGKLFVFPLQIEGGEDIFDVFEKYDHMYNLENIQNLRIVSSDNFDFTYEISLEAKSSLITGFDSSKRKAQITIPKRLQPVSGILKDRIELGLKLAKELSKSGCCHHLSSHKVYSRQSLMVSKEVTSSLKKSLENLSCIVLQEKT